MGELGLDIKVSHPVDEVWSALTKPEILRLWLMENDFRPTVGHRCTFWPRPEFPRAEEPISVVVLAVEPARRIVMEWRSGDVSAEVTWCVQPRKSGCLLRIREVGATARPLGQVQSRAMLSEAFRRRLPALLSRQRAVRARRSRERWPRWLWRTSAIGGPVAAVVLAVMMVMNGSTVDFPSSRAVPGLAPPGEGAVGVAPTPANAGTGVSISGPSPGATPGAAVSGEQETATATVGLTGAAVPNPTGDPRRLVAEYTIVGAGTASGGSSQLYSVAITNPGSVPVTGWQVVITFSGESPTISDVRGAVHDYSSGEHVFRPVPATKTVPQHRPVTFTFTVTAAGGGTLGGLSSCTIDGYECVPG